MLQSNASRHKPVGYKLGGKGTHEQRKNTAERCEILVWSNFYIGAKRFATMC